MTLLSKILIAAGSVLVITGVLLRLGLGRLPGDIYIRKDNFVFYFPVVSAILVCVIATLAAYFIRRH
ncbi:MAG: DUF2905 domain-containing protein [Elusimicrobia bacterium]|nr:DUF2905 domain-containing protein [Elusimicrobiota bacterium]